MSDDQTGVVRGQKTRTIGDREYTTKPLPARIGLDIYARLVSYAGAEVVALLFALPAEKRDNTLASKGIQSQILHRFCTNAIASATDKEGNRTQERPMDLLWEMLANTECDKIQLGDTTVPGNVQKHFDEHFKGDYRHLIEVVEFVGEVNFAGP